MNSIKPHFFFFIRACSNCPLWKRNGGGGGPTSSSTNTSLGIYFNIRRLHDSGVEDKARHLDDISSAG